LENALNALLKKEISNWNDNERSFFLLIAKTFSSGFEHGVFADSIVEQYEHLDIFTNELKLNQKGIRIIQFLQTE